MANDKFSGRLIPVIFGSRPVMAGADLSDDDLAPILDLAPRLAARASPASTGDQIGFMTNKRGEVIITAGRLRYGGDNKVMREWASRLVSSCCAAERAKDAAAARELWGKAILGESCSAEPPYSGRNELLARLNRATALAVARSLYRLDLDELQAQAIAETLTGRKMAAGSDPASKGTDLGIGRDGGVFLILRWRELLSAQGLTPLVLHERDKTAEIALEAARHDQAGSGVRYFRFNKRVNGFEVWLWKGGHGRNLASEHRSEPKPRSRAAAIDWAMRYAKKHGFAYLEGI